MTYRELCELTGLSSNTILKAISNLNTEGKIKKIPSPTRRYANNYIVDTDVLLVSKPRAKKSTLGNLLAIIDEIREELKEIRKENIELKTLLGTDGNIDIVSRSKIGEDSFMIVSQLPTT